MKRRLKNTFIPHEGNNYQPHILQKAAMTGMVGLVVLTFTLANLQAMWWLNVDWLISAVLPAVVVSETNDERADEAVLPLRRSVTLDRAAQLKAEHMADLGYFAHYAPDGTSPWHWFRSTNYNFVHAGENLAVHFNDSREVVRAWMNSPTHRANIVNGDFTEIGIGVAEGTFEGYDTVFVVQLFGTPAAAPVVAEATAPDTVTVITEQVAPAPVVTESQVAAAEETIIEAPTEVAPAVVAIVPEPVTLPDTEAIITDTVPDTIVVEAPETLETPSTTVVVADSEQFISTSTNAVPATIAPDTTVRAERPGFLATSATSPQLVLQTLYTILGLMVLVVLLYSLALEWRRQDMVQVAYSFSLLLIMTGLYYLQSVVTAGATIL